MDQYKTYQTVEGDTFDMIALDFYNDEFKAPIIARANPDFAGAVVLAAGINLKVPIIPQSAVAQLPPWKRV